MCHATIEAINAELGRAPSKTKNITPCIFSMAELQAQLEDRVVIPPATEAGSPALVAVPASVVMVVVAVA